MSQKQRTYRNCRRPYKRRCWTLLYTTWFSCRSACSISCCQVSRCPVPRFQRPR